MNHFKQFASILLLPCLAQAGAITFSASGSGAASIQTTIDAFRATLGANNPNVAGSFGSGRREINWDGVGAAFRDPHPTNFFNSNSPRGVVFSHDGTRLVVSGDVGAPDFLFENLTPYSSAANFSTFSGPRLFGIVGGNTLTVNFFIPGSSTPAFTNGFGAVFTDVEVANGTSITYYDENDLSLGTFFVPTASNAGLSFLGVRFDAGEKISKVVLDVGNGAFTDGGCNDCVLMDDFIYGEPTAIPEPSTFLLSAGGIALSLWIRRRQ